MGGKHLKRLRAEKSKVHLKKKKLSKGENVTNTAFTVKKILAVEQLKKVDKDEPVSNWNIPLKDLLVRLNHYNLTSRVNSLIGIKELLTKYPEIIGGPSLKLLISRLLELITDEEHKVRVTATDLLSYLFGLISESSIIVFGKLLNVHLACAMTHRNVSIQQDSLKLIDVMIMYSPDVIKCNFQLIAQNFIRIIKSYFYESHVGVFSSGKSKQDLEKGKREMLLRFYKFIVAGCPRISETKPSVTASSNINVLMGQKMSLRGLKDEYKKLPDLLFFKNLEKKENVLCDISASEFMSLCSLVIPLLCDTWMEFSLCQRFDQRPECVLTEDAGELLTVLLKILLFLHDAAVTLHGTELVHWFTSNYSGAFKKSFTHNFPYLPPVSTDMLKGKNLSESPKGFNVYMLPNLIVCYLAYSLKVIDKNSTLETRIENYVSGAVMMLTTTTTTTNEEETEILLKVVKAGIHGSKQEVSNIFSPLVASYDRICSPEFRRCLSKILMNIAMGGGGSETQKDQIMVNWMKSLPDRLCQLQVFVEEVETILKLITVPNGAEVLREIECKAEEILENLQNIKVEGTAEFEGQRMIVAILYRCNSEILMRLMQKKILHGRKYHPDLKKYILEIFSQKVTSHLESCEV